jgi:translation initiation factor 2B subunit (eIF-2B alpha/beta/delta family)
VRPPEYFGKLMISNLQHVGYNVTYLADSEVTVDFLVHPLNDYAW